MRLPGARVLATTGGAAAVVTAGAALWGTDALFRLGLSERLPAATVVFGTHAVLLLATGGLLPQALAAARRAGPRKLIAAAVLGAGSSAGATLLFTLAFSYGDPVTPVLLQKAQPVLAVVAARFLLGERPRRSYWPFLAAAVAGAWLVAFPDPFGVAPDSAAAAPALLGLGAALLWGLGTVLGRYLVRDLTVAQTSTLRFAGGFVASGAMVAATGAPAWPGTGQLPAILGLALVPGLLAVALYYRGLAHTPATVATLCELAFPFTAALVGVAFLGGTMTASQIAGMVLMAATVTAMGLVNGRTLRQGRTAAAPEPAPATADR